MIIITASLRFHPSERSPTAGAPGARHWGHLKPYKSWGEIEPLTSTLPETNSLHLEMGHSKIAAFLQFQTVSNLFQTSLGCPQISIQADVGSADIAAFLQFQTVSDLFQTSLGCPQISIQIVFQPSIFRWYVNFRGVHMLSFNHPQTSGSLAKLLFELPSVCCWELKKLGE